jgi:hypothetical protein
VSRDSESDPPPRVRSMPASVKRCPSHKCGRRDLLRRARSERAGCLARPATAGRCRVSTSSRRRQQYCCP